MLARGLFMLYMVLMLLMCVVVFLHGGSEESYCGLEAGQSVSIESFAAPVQVFLPMEETVTAARYEIVKVDCEQRVIWFRSTPQGTIRVAVPFHALGSVFDTREER